MSNASSDDAYQANLERQLRVWEKVIDVQQHFNDIAMRVRNLFVTLVAALFAIIGYAIRFSNTSAAPSLTTDVARFAPVIASVSMFACAAFWFLDRLWYHRLLVGAVKHGESLESSLEADIPGIGLTKSISLESRITTSALRLSATLRLDIFYISFGAAAFFLWMYVIHADSCKYLAGGMLFILVSVVAIVNSTRRIYLA